MIRALWRLVMDRLHRYRAEARSARLHKAIQNGTAKRGRTQ